MQQRIFVIPIGKVDREVLSATAAGLAEIYHAQIETGEVVPIPEDAYDRRRDQYHSTTILHMLEKIVQKLSGRALGVIDRDLFVPELNFVFGEAGMTTGVAVISVTRLRQEYYSLRPDSGLFLQRTVKEATHELGHTFGLGHCRDPKCIMRFSNSLSDTDRKGPGFCSPCRQRLAARSGE